MEDMGLSDNGDEPLVGLVTRMVDHKGMDLVRFSIEALIHEGFKFVILGSGDYMYEDFFREVHNRYPDRISTTIGFVPELAKRIYGGADMFLMPSKSEPCGLAQMISLRYGTIPIVRETGGLKDSIRDARLGEGNGFTFSDYHAGQMMDALRCAKDLYYKKEDWLGLVKYGMSCDFSWKSAALKYVNMYKEILS